MNNDSFNLPEPISLEELMRRAGLDRKPEQLEVEIRRRPEVLEYECHILRRKTKGDGMVNVVDNKVSCEHFDLQKHGTHHRCSAVNTMVWGTACPYTKLPQGYD